MLASSAAVLGLELGVGVGPHGLKAGNAACPLGFVRGQENDGPDAELGFDREPAACGSLPWAFHALPRIFSSAPWPIFGLGSLHRMPVDGRVAGFTGRCLALTYISLKG